MRPYSITTSLIILTLSMSNCKDQTGLMQEIEDRYSIGYVETTYGAMHFWLYDQTPNHKAKFIELANLGHYDQFTFNRVIRDFVIQGGCPDSPQYFTNSPYLLEPEFVDSIKHVYGALGMGRDDNAKKKSNACQFYVVNKASGLPRLDGDYMIFGILIKGEDVLEAIEIVQTNANDEPIQSIPLTVSIKEFTDTELSDSLGFTRPK
jgi:cyclophilin family peptidyl-prolyl cis-trans isomerase